MNGIWFTSDTHFYHKNILNFCPNTRTGSDYLEMTETIVENWNRDVKVGDRVYILGDVSFGNAADTKNVLRRLNGHIHLIYGNHDRVIQSNYDIRMCFASVDNYKEIKIGHQKVVMFHFPMLEWNGMHHGAFALFGHVHGSMDNHPEILPWRNMDVGIDSRPGGIEPEGGKMSLWNWDQVQSILSKRAIKRHH